MTDQTLVLVDGENLILRYQALCTEGKTPSNENIHKKDVFVWHPKLTSRNALSVLRVSYYTTFVGSAEQLAEVHNEVSDVKYIYQDAQYHGNGTLNPHIYKKERNKSKTKSVDINLTVDALRHAYNKDVRRIIICSGDGDYIPLIKEVMKQGVIVEVNAFSSGCHPELKYIADDFFELDKLFFKKTPTEPTEQPQPDNPEPGANSASSS